MPVSLRKIAKDRNLKYFLITFVDLFGVARAKLVPAVAIDAMQNEGAGFAGFAAHLDMTPAHPDMLAIPDPASLVQLPWKPEVGWLAADPWMNGKAVAQAPRNVLKSVLARAKKLGFSAKSGVECEYFVISEDGTTVADPLDRQGKPCYDQQALMRRYDMISEICDNMQKLGWDAYQNDHEDANGQFEMNWGYADALITADRHVFFKYMVRSIAEKHGLRATFMPKPLPQLTGNGCHCHVSLWKGKRNVFHDARGELGLSAVAYHFIGGLLVNAVGMAAIMNPVVNSYKRVGAPVTKSGATWSPNTVTYGGNNRTHMIRIPADDRIEIRLADGAANPYLLQAACLAVGINGIEKKTPSGKRLDIDMYAEADKVKNAPRLPANLLDALRALEKNAVLKDWLGDEWMGAYLKLKHAEWDSFMAHFSRWERENALDV